MSNHQFEFESRAVYKALKRMTADYALQHAGFNYWKANHSKSVLNVVDFSTDLHAYLDLTSKEKSSFMVALHAAMTLSLEALPPVPAVMLDVAPVNAEGGRAEAVQVPSFNAPNSPQWLMITRFLKESVAEVKKISKSAFVDFQEILIEEQGDLDTAQWNLIKSWVNSGFTQLGIDEGISKADCSVFSHYTYLIICEIVGAVKADKMVHSIVIRLSELPEKEGFDPSNLL